VQEQQRLQTELVKFESTYQMISEACQQKFEEGELGDTVEFFEWTSVYSIYQHNAHMLRLLEENSLSSRAEFPAPPPRWS
jgi:hypothetical protein